MGQNIVRSKAKDARSNGHALCHHGLLKAVGSNVRIGDCNSAAAAAQALPCLSWLRWFGRLTLLASLSCFRGQRDGLRHSHSQWTMNCRLAARSRWTTDSGLLTRTNMKQATSAWGAIKEMEALKFLCCCPKQHVRNKALIHQPSGSTAEDPHCQVEAQETWKKALQRSRASLKRAMLWTLDFGL